METRYSRDGYWLRPSGSIYRIGVTPQLIARLGSVVLAEPSEAGTVLRQGAEAGVIETSKAVSDLVMPLSGVITKVNPEILVDPGRVSDDPTGFGWLYELDPSDPSELRGLLDEADYLEALRG